MNRILRVARIHLTAWPTAFGWPLGILGISFAINLAFYASLGEQILGPSATITGGLASIYFVQLITCWQAIIQFFSFAVGLNVTRRTYYLAVFGVAVLQSFAFALLVYVLALIEHATDGWGIGLPFFDPLPVTHGNSPLNILVYAMPLVLLSVLGLFLGTVTKRWGVNGFFGLTMLSILLGGAFVVLMTLTHSWPAIGDFLTAQSGFGLLVGWILVPVVALTAGAYALLRRAVP